jgi:hypothetical protein
MAGPGVTYTGPVISGPIWNPGDLRGPVNTGLSLLAQTGTLTAAGASTVTFQFNLPSGSQIVDIIADTTVVWNSGTSDTLSVGLTAGGTDFASGIPVGTGEVTPRQCPVYTAAQLAAQLVVGATPSNGVPVFATVTPVGTAATAGSTTVTLVYIQTVQLLAGDA